MLREVALWIGYTVLALGAGAGTLALIAALVWWITQKIVAQWVNMDLFWHTCFEIAVKRKDEKRRQAAQLDFDAIKARGSK